MGEMLAELEDVLRSKLNHERITEKEVMLLQSCKERAIGNFIGGTMVSSVAVWIASRRLTQGHRFNISVGSAIFTGMWRFNRSLNSCVDRILKLEGSRMQMELAQIIVNKHSNNDSRMKLVKKYFYPEEVFSDSNPDKSYNRWRHRNIYFDDTSLQNSDVKGSTFHENIDLPETIPQTKQSPRSSAAVEILADPLDCIFGQGEAAKVIPRPDNSVATRKQLRAHKRAHRRHRAHHTESKISIEDRKIII